MKIIAVKHQTIALLQTEQGNQIGHVLPEFADEMVKRWNDAEEVTDGEK